LVLVILAVMWVLVLVPPLLRSRTDGRPNHSISSFQRQLRTLQRTGHGSRGSVTYLRSTPQLGRAALPPRGVPTSRYVDERFDEWYDEPSPARGYAVDYQPDAYGYGRSSRSMGVPRARPRPSARAVAAEREAMRRRRQNVLLSLIGACFVTAVVGFGMGVSVMVWAFVASVAALVLYVLVLIQLQRAAELRSYRSSWSRVAA
jgi:hypothetical protein